MNQPGPHTWELSFSYGRALQAPALKAWQGEPANVEAGRQAFYRRAKFNGAARSGSYAPEWEKEEVPASSPRGSAGRRPASLPSLGPRGRGQASQRAGVVGKPPRNRRPASFARWPLEMPPATVVSFAGGRRRSVRRLHLQLPCVPTSNRKRLRDAGGLQSRSSAGHRSLQRLRTTDERTRTRARLRSPVRFPGLLHGREPDLSSSRSGVRRPPDRAERLRAGGCPTTCPWDSARPLYDAGRYAAAADRGRGAHRGSRPGVPLLQRGVLREPRGPNATPSSTSAGRSTCGRGVATWRRRTPISIRSATSPRSTN